MRIRMDSIATNNNAIVQYYNLLEDLLQEYNLNMDEDGMPHDHCPLNVIARWSERKVQ